MSAGFVVAVDGPAGSGKSTVSDQVAAALGFVKVNTGALYRCIALAGQRAGLSPDDELEMGAVARRIEIQFDGDRVFLDGEDVSQSIRAPEISSFASISSALGSVRSAILEEQRRLGRQEPGAVLEGRDIGTVVFPDADLKVFLTASPQERARRRHEQLKAQGEHHDLADLLEQIIARDARDRSRSEAPLVQAKDARELVTDGLTIDQVVDLIVSWAQEEQDP
ncbi:MAG TPA: (d)CMP kinase [Myxococcales bacterium]|nr:cytidylate kinase [Myxococcales bacterium]HBU49135.1 (d)CMP kinase [Myxococcales bacterium]